MLPAASDAAHVTEVDPSGNNEPDGGVQATPPTTATSSLAWGRAKLTTAPEGPVASAMIGGGVATMGGVTSPHRMSAMADGSPRLSRPSPSISANAVTKSMPGAAGPV